MESKDAPMTPPDRGTNHEDRPTVETGSQIGILYGIIDLGTQIVEWQGSEKQQRKILLQFEFPEFTHVFDEDKGPQPLVLSRKFTWSTSDKGHFRNFIEGWRGTKFSDTEFEQFDVKKMLGVPAMINIVERKASNSDRVYQNIDSASKLHKSMSVPEQHNPNIFFHVNHHGFESEIFKGLYEWIKKILAESLEYQEAYNTKQLLDKHKSTAGDTRPTAMDQKSNKEAAPGQSSQPSSEAPKQEPNAAPGFDDDDDDLPF